MTLRVPVDRPMSSATTTPARLFGQDPHRSAPGAPHRTQTFLVALHRPARHPDWRLKLVVPTHRLRDQRLGDGGPVGRRAAIVLVPSGRRWPRLGRFRLRDLLGEVPRQPGKRDDLASDEAVAGKASPEGEVNLLGPAIGVEAFRKVDGRLAVPATRLARPASRPLASTVLRAERSSGTRTRRLCRPAIEKRRLPTVTRRLPPT